MKKLIIMCLAIGTMAACNGPKEVQQEVSAPAVPETPAVPNTTMAGEVDAANAEMKDAALNGQNAPAWAFTVKRQPCFGKCPWDVFTVRADGSILYEGKRDVERIGVYTGNLSIERVEELRNKLDDLGYMDWEAKYDNNISDLPSIELLYRAQDGLSKNVFIRGEAPTGTESLMNLMLGLYESVQQWEQIDDPEVPHNE